MANRRTSVEIAEGSYLETVAHGARSRYICLAVDERIARVRSALGVMRSGRTDSEIAAIVEAMDLPAWRASSESDIKTLNDSELAAAALLAAESEATGLEPVALIAVLDGGKAA